MRANNDFGGGGRLDEPGNNRGGGAPPSTHDSKEVRRPEKALPEATIEIGVVKLMISGTPNKSNFEIIHFMMASIFLAPDEARRVKYYGDNNNKWFYCDSQTNVWTNRGAAKVLAAMHTVV